MHPGLLLSEKFDFSHEPISIGTEYLTTHGKSIDNLFVARDGKIILVEDKLLKNESSRRVIAQTIDYAQDMQKWSYEDLNDAFKKQVKKNPSKQGLYEYINEYSGGTVDQYEFVRNVEKNLSTATILILIVGDKIHNDTEFMAAFLNQHTTMNFQIGLIEIEVYITDEGDWIVIPYLTKKSEVVEKQYIRIFSTSGDEDQVMERVDTEYIENESKASDVKTANVATIIPDEAIYSEMEEAHNTVDVREGIQSIIDDIINMQLEGFFIKRGTKSFCIYLKSPKLKRPLSILNVFSFGADFDPNVFYWVLRDSNMTEKSIQSIRQVYINFLEKRLGFHTRKVIYTANTLSSLSTSKIDFFTELRSLAKAINEAEAN